MREDSNPFAAFFAEIRMARWEMERERLREEARIIAAADKIDARLASGPEPEPQDVLPLPSGGVVDMTGEGIQ